MPSSLPSSLASSLSSQDPQLAGGKLHALVWCALSYTDSPLPGRGRQSGNMQRVVICLALLACLLHTSAAFDWQPCSDSSKTADIDKVSLTPEQPAAGDTVKFLVDGTASAHQLPAPGLFPI